MRPGILSAASFASRALVARSIMTYLAKALLTGAEPLPLITTVDPLAAGGTIGGPAHSR
jgi:hypothetical protein